MVFDAWLTLVILAATFATLVATKLPPVTVFIGALTLCITFGLAPIERCLAGFANPGVMTIGALFMVAAGMYSTGAITLLSDKVIGRPKTTNLIIAGMVVDAIAKGGGGSQLREISLFDPSWVAVPAMILGLVLLIMLSRWLLKSPETTVSDTVVDRSYGAEFVIPKASPLAGKTIEIAGFAEPVGFKLADLIGADGSRVLIDPGTTLAEGDVLLISADLDSLASLWTMRGLAPLNTMNPMETARHRHQLVETVISPQSAALGRRISDFPDPDSPFRLSLVAVSRDGEAVPGRIGDLTIEVGDVAVIEVDDSFFYVNRGELDSGRLWLDEYAERRSSGHRRYVADALFDDTERRKQHRLQYPGSARRSHRGCRSRLGKWPGGPDRDHSHQPGGWECTGRARGRLHRPGCHGQPDHERRFSRLYVPHRTLDGQPARGQLHAVCHCLDDRDHRSGRHPALISNKPHGTGPG